MSKTKLRTAPTLVGVIASVTVLGAGPALGARLSKCTTIDKPGFYELTRNLTAAGSCLVVTADFVTIDLGGWVITGDGSGAGIASGGREGIVVRNGTVANFEGGVGVGSFSVVEKVRTFDNVFGITTGLKSIVTGNSVQSVGEFGILAGGGNIVSGNNVRGGNIGLSADERSIISGNIVGGGEIAIIAAPGSTVSGNTTEFAVFGIRAAPGSTVSGNTVRAAEDIGIEVNCPSNVIGNTATDSPTNLVLSGAGCTNIDNLAP